MNVKELREKLEFYDDDSPIRFIFRESDECVYECQWLIFEESGNFIPTLTIECS